MCYKQDSHSTGRNYLEGKRPLETEVCMCMILALASELTAIRSSIQPMGAPGGLHSYVKLQMIAHRVISFFIVKASAMPPYY